MIRRSVISSRELADILKVNHSSVSLLARYYLKMGVTTAEPLNGDEVRLSLISRDRPKFSFEFSEVDSIVIAANLAPTRVKKLRKAWGCPLSVFSEGSPSLHYPPGVRGVGVVPRINSSEHSCG